MAVAVISAVACGSKASVEGIISDAPSSEVIVKLLNVDRYEVLDTVETDASGRFGYKVDVQKGQPEFVYLFYKDRKVASMLLMAGDKVSVETDTLGRYSVSGSQESLKLAQVEKDYADVMARMNALSEAIAAEKDSGKAGELRRALGKEYVDYYRHCVRYVLDNSSSLTAVQVLYQNLGENLPVFGQMTDAIHFRNLSDSLSVIYPESRYVKALVKEADRRYGYMELDAKLRSAKEIGFVDMELPDIKGQKQRLSQMDSKVVVICFWSAADNSQKMFNLDVLKPLYDRYHKKGLDIYQVSLDVDKATWAGVVKEQNLPWINVCDSRGAASPYASVYNVAAVPAVFVISEGALVDGQAVDEESFRGLIGKLLK